MVDFSERNRANARSSTGPRTPEGKRIIASNAIRHGVLARPRAENVALWLSIILSRPRASISDLTPKNDREHRALALAHAEAWVSTSEQALIDFEEGRLGVWFVDRTVEADVQSDLALLQDLRSQQENLDGTSRKGQRALKFIDDWIHRLSTPRAVPPEKQYWLLKRYLGEARAKRRRAFAAWLEAQ